MLNATLATGTPAVSIVIIAWRLVEPLRVALDALARQDGAPPFEVIVVVNGDGPRVRGVVDAHPVVDRVIPRIANLGFGAAANLGATIARGEAIVFLNDDAAPEPGWLAALAAAAAEHPGDAIGSLLLFPDGRVQEAGARMLADGRPELLGRGRTLEEAGRQGLLEPRAVEYCSAAALLVPAADFVAIGGFDPVYEPAYYEDVDLQYRLQERGAVVRLAPQARVRHLGSTSTDTDRWFRRFAAERAKAVFLERWRDVLDQPEQSRRIPLRERVVVPIDQRADVDDSAARALHVVRAYTAWLIAELERRDARIAALDGELAAERDRAQDAERRLADLHASTSWRLTAPIRAVKARLGVRRPAFRADAPGRPGDVGAGGQSTQTADAAGLDPTAWEHDWQERAEFHRAIDETIGGDAERLRSLTVSVVMPVRNRAGLVGRAIASVLAQSHRRFELIVVDDGSEDDTPEAIAAYDDPRIRTFRQEPAGVSAARNTALDAAVGDIVCFLDSDNVWMPDHLRTMTAYLGSSDDTVAYGGLRVRDDDGRLLRSLGAPFDYAACRAGNYIDLNVLGYRRQPFAHARFDTALRRLVDWDLLLTITREAGATFLPYHAADYYDGDRHARISRVEHQADGEFETLSDVVRGRHPLPAHPPRDRGWRKGLAC